MNVKKILTTISILGLFLFIIAFSIYGLFGEEGRNILTKLTSQAVMFILSFTFTALLIYRKSDSFSLICSLASCFILLIGYALYYFCRISPLWHTVSSLIFDAGTFLLVLTIARDRLK
jgi:hypothetical protein